MKKSLIPLAAVILALVATSAGVLALTGGDSIRSDEGIDPNECNLVHNINACDQEDLDRLGGDALLPANSDGASTQPGCELGALECDDTPDTCDPVPLRSDCGIDPNECNLVHNIDACGEVLNPPGPFEEPAGEGDAHFQVTVQFNTSYTQEDIDEADALLHAFDENLEFVVMEIFPPIGSAVLALETSDECSTISAQLEAKSYVAGVSCEPWQPGGAVEPGDVAQQAN